MSRVRIMIVDDRPIFRAGVHGMLRDFQDIQVVAEAANGRQAIDMARRFKPELALMDLNMPEMGGVAATRALKTEFPEMVILALTVSEVEEDVVEMVAAGASGYVLKDVDPVTLARAIEDACSGRFLLDDALTRRVILRLGAALKRQPRPAVPSPLTEREAAILQMVVQGKSNRQIGAQLEVSEGTVKSHLRNIYRKLQVQTRAEAAARGARLHG